MASVRLARTAEIDLEALIVSRSLPLTTRRRVRDALEPLERFPLMGGALTGRWQGFRFVLGPWPWMLLVYTCDEATDTVSVFFVQDARVARSATSNG